MNKIIAFVLAFSLALPFSYGAAFVPEKVEHSAEAEYMAEDYYVYGEHKCTELDKWFNVQFNLYNTWRPGNHNWYMATADKVVGLWIDITNVPESDNSYPFAGSFEVMQTSNQDTAAAASHRNN